MSASASDVAVSLDWHGALMPWCEECAKYWTPNSMNEDGTCPACGRVVEEPTPAAPTDEEKAPWHFKLMVGALVLYLGWRLVELFQ